jgi:hypothetical protein
MAVNGITPEGAAQVGLIAGHVAADDISGSLTVE